MRRGIIGAQFFVGMIMAILLLAVGIYYCNRVGQIVSRGMENSIDGLADALESVKAEPGKLANKVLTIEEGGIVLFFMPARPELHAKFNVRGVDEPFTFMRPPACPLDKFCVCGCHLKGNPGVLVCDLPFCRSLDGVRFYDNFRDCRDDERGCFKWVDGGAAFYNQFQFFNSGVGQMDRRGQPRPTQSVTLENYEGLVAVCDTQPCITDDDKKLIRQQVALDRLARDMARCAQAAAHQGACGCGTFEISKELPERWQITFARQDAGMTGTLTRDGRKRPLSQDTYLASPCLARAQDGRVLSLDDLTLTWANLQANGAQGHLAVPLAGGGRRLGLAHADGQVCFADLEGLDGEHMTLRDSGEILARDGSQVLAPCSYT